MVNANLPEVTFPIQLHDHESLHEDLGAEFNLLSWWCEACWQRGTAYGMNRPEMKPCVKRPMPEGFFG